jgi:hypothetical protein
MKKLVIVSIIIIFLLAFLLLYLRFFVYTDNPIINFKCEFNTCSGTEGLSCVRPSGKMICDLSRRAADICRNLAYCSNSLTKCEFKKTSGFDQCVECINSCFIPDLENLFRPGLEIDCMKSCYLNVTNVDVCNEISNAKLRKNCINSIAEVKKN